MSHNYIYLIHTIEYKCENKHIYKIGKSTQINHARFNTYPKGSELILQIQCINCHTMETRIINEFKKKYKKHSVGNEYFEGDVGTMKNDIYDLLKAEDKEYKQQMFDNLVHIKKYEYYGRCLSHFAKIEDDDEGCERCVNNEIELALDRVIEPGIGREYKLLLDLGQRYEKIHTLETEYKLILETDQKRKHQYEQTQDSDAEREFEYAPYYALEIRLQRKFLNTMLNKYTEFVTKISDDTDEMLCIKCNKQISNIPDFIKHLKSKEHIYYGIVKDKINYECDICLNKFKTKTTMTRHKNTCKDTEHMEMMRSIKRVESNLNIIKQTIGI